MMSKMQKSTAPGIPRRSPRQGLILKKIDQSLSHVEQRVSSTDQSLSDVEETPCSTDQSASPVEQVDISSFGVNSQWQDGGVQASVVFLRCEK